MKREAICWNGLEPGHYWNAGADEVVLNQQLNTSSVISSFWTEKYYQTQHQFVFLEAMYNLSDNFQGQI